MTKRGPIPKNAPPPVQIGAKGVELSRKEIARRTGLSLALVSRIFSGKRRLTVETARLMAWAFDATVHEVYEEMRRRYREMKSQDKAKAQSADEARRRTVWRKPVGDSADSSI